MTPYTTLETLTALALTVLVLYVVYMSAALMYNCVRGVMTLKRLKRQTRTTVEDRRERLLKLIASTDREER